MQALDAALGACNKPPVIPLPISATVDNIPSVSKKSESMVISNEHVLSKMEGGHIDRIYIVDGY